MRLILNSIPEWKKLLKELDISKYLTRSDYGHIARLHLQAAGRRIVVKVRDIEKDIAAVYLYLQKGRRQNENHLTLEALFDKLVRDVQGTTEPDYITVEYPVAPGGDSSSMPDAWNADRASSVLSAATSLISRTRESDDSTPSSQGLSPSRSESSNETSSYASSTTPGNISDEASIQRSVESATSSPRYVTSRRPMATPKLASRATKAYDAFYHSIEALITGVSMPHHEWPTEDIFAALSFTPYAPQEQRPGPIIRVPSEQVHQNVRMVDANRPKEGKAGTQDSDAISFVTRAHLVCILRGQQEPQDASRMLDLAKDDFKALMISQPDLVLPVLNLLTALLESYGQREFGLEVLDIALAIWKDSRGGGDDCLSDSVTLMKDGLKWSGNSTENLVSRLEKVHTAVSVMWGGERSRSALAVKWQIAWALTIKGRWDEAEKHLVDLRAQCGTGTGVFLTSIMAAATHARVRFRQRHPLEARGIMAEVIKRLGAVLPTYHPYYLESLTRQARFLQDLKEPADVECAKRLLWTVLESRYRILGPNNRKTRETFKQLQNLLRESGREGEANGLWETMRQKDWFHQ